MAKKSASPSTVVYLVLHHPPEWESSKGRFEWLRDGGDEQRALADMLGRFDPEILEMMIDEEPAGREWTRLLNDLMDQKIKRVVTHLAPLSAAQRQQLIGICSEVGAHLVTPSDAGRNRLTGDVLH